MAQAKIGGSVAEGYESIQAYFHKLFSDGREDNAQVCVYVDGKKVVDLWGSANGDEDYDGDVLHTVIKSFYNHWVVISLKVHLYN